MLFNLQTSSINYIKIKFQDRDKNEACLKFAIKEISKSDILASAQVEDFPSIPYPQEVIVSFICENGLYKTTTTLKYVLRDENIITFAIIKPENVDLEQNREFFRVRTHENATIYFDTENGKQVIKTKLFDLSANGIRFVLPTQIEIPEYVNATIYFETKTFSSRLYFMRYDEEDNIPKIAFKFDNLKEIETDFLSQICIQKQLEYRRSLLL